MYMNNIYQEIQYNLHINLCIKFYFISRIYLDLTLRGMSLGEINQMNKYMICFGPKLSCYLFPITIL